LDSSTCAEVGGYQTHFGEVQAKNLDSDDNGKPNNYHKVLSEFIEAEDIDCQRKILESDGQAVIEAHIECLYKYEQKRDLMSYILPSLDGILYDNEGMVEHIFSLMNRKITRNVIQKLQKFLPSPSSDKIGEKKGGFVSQEKYNSVIVGAACRILSVILSNQNHYREYMTDCKLLVNLLSNLKGQNAVSD